MTASRRIETTVVLVDSDRMAEDLSTLDSETLDLRALVGHAESVQANATVEETQALFARKGLDFMAVADGHNLVGVCARRDINRQLSSRYGFALFAQKPVTVMLQTSPLRVSQNTPITEVFKAASARKATELFDDLLLVDGHERYLGMIPMRTLVRLQTQFLMRHNAQLEVSRAEIAAKNRAIEEDLAMAREVQLALLPARQASVTVEGYTLSISHRYRAAGQMSGDFFEVLHLSDHSRGILVCDVMGHGIRSALITAMMRAMIEELRSVADAPGIFLTRLNRDLTRILRRTGGLIFVTAAYVVVNFTAGRLYYAQAGHPTPLCFDPATRNWKRIDCLADCEGPAIGLMEEFAYSSVESSFEPDSRLLVFTDGLTEAANPDGEEFGLDRLTASLDRRTQHSLDETLDGVLSEVTAFGGEPFADDICIVAAESTATIFRPETSTA